jgi:hypothetical protein
MKAACSFKVFLSVLPYCTSDFFSYCFRVFFLKNTTVKIKKRRLSAAFSFVEARSQNFEKRLFASSCLSVCPSAWNNSAPYGRIFMKFDSGVFVQNLSRKFGFYYNLTIRGTLREDLCTIMIMYRCIFLGMINVSDRSYKESQNTHFMLSFFFSKILLFIR